MYFWGLKQWLIKSIKYWYTHTLDPKGAFNNNISQEVSRLIRKCDLIVWIDTLRNDTL